MVDDNKYKERISAVERDVSHLGAGLQAVEVEMREGFHTIRRAIEHQRTPMSQLAGWATVGLTLIAAILWPQIKSDERHEKLLNNIYSEFLDHVRDGHPRRIEEKIAGFNANQWEKIRSLERRIYEKPMSLKHGSVGPSQNH